MDSGDTFSRLHLGRELTEWCTCGWHRLTPTGNLMLRNLYQSVLLGPTCVAGHPEHRTHTRLNGKEVVDTLNLRHTSTEYCMHLFQKLELFNHWFPSQEEKQSAKPIKVLNKLFFFARTFSLVNLPGITAGSGGVGQKLL